MKHWAAPVLVFMQGQADEARNAPPSDFTQGTFEYATSMQALTSTVTWQIKLMLAGLLVAICECLPLGILQIVYSNRIEGKLQTIDMLSTVTSWY